MIYTAGWDCSTTIRFGGISVIVKCIQRKPYEGKLHVRFVEGLIGSQSDDLLERDTRPKGEKRPEDSQSLHTTALLFYSTFNKKMFRLLPMIVTFRVGMGFMRERFEAAAGES